jgi:hypothetical protein
MVVTVQGATGDMANLSLSRHEVELLEAQLSRDVARMEDELLEGRDGYSAFAQQVADLRRLDARLRRLMQDFEPLPDIV